MACPTATDRRGELDRRSPKRKEGFAPLLKVLAREKKQRRSLTRKSPASGRTHQLGKLRPFWSQGPDAPEHFGFFLPEMPRLEAGAQGLCVPGPAVHAAGRYALQFDPFAISNAGRPPSDHHHLAFQRVPSSSPKTLMPALLKLACRQQSPGISSRCRFQLTGSHWLDILHVPQAPRRFCCWWWSMYPKLSSQGWGGGGS